MQFVCMDTISILGKSAMNARAMFAEKQLAKKVAVTIHALVALTKIVMNVTHIIPDLRRMRMTKIAIETLEIDCKKNNMPHVPIEAFTHKRWSVLRCFLQAPQIKRLVKFTIAGM